MKERSFALFGLGNLCVGIAFYGIWLSSWWIPSVERMQDALTDFQWMASLFVCFFVASFIPLFTAGKTVVVLKSLGFASVFTVGFFCLLVVSIIILGPLLPLD
jgi:hypothetical protein